MSSHVAGPIHQSSPIGTPPFKPIWTPNYPLSQSNRTEHSLFTQPIWPPQPPYYQPLYPFYTWCGPSYPQPKDSMACPPPITTTMPVTSMPQATPMPQLLNPTVVLPLTSHPLAQPQTCPPTILVSPVVPAALVQDT